MLLVNASILSGKLSKLTVQSDTTFKTVTVYDSDLSDTEKLKQSSRGWLTLSESLFELRTKSRLEYEALFDFLSTLYLSKYELSSHSSITDAFAGSVVPEAKIRVSFEPISVGSYKNSQELAYVLELMHLNESPVKDGLFEHASYPFCSSQLQQRGAEVLKSLSDLAFVHEGAGFELLKFRRFFEENRASIDSHKEVFDLLQSSPKLCGDITTSLHIILLSEDIKLNRFASTVDDKRRIREETAAKQATSAPKSSQRLLKF